MPYVSSGGVVLNYLHVTIINLKIKLLVNVIMKILVTGCAGFIGSHVCERLLQDKHIVFGIDNLSGYYNVIQKQENIEILKLYPNFLFNIVDITDKKQLNIINRSFDVIVHLAGMAGVRNSINDPNLYVKNNIMGTINLLDLCRENEIKRFVYSSSSSVYGLNTKIPFKEDDPIEKCNSPYAVTKLSKEAFCSLYHQLYGIHTIGLRFFTVYGPRGRPDMAPFKFMDSIILGRPIDKYGNGDSMRDYTYISDTVDGVVSAVEKSSYIKNEIYNLGNTNPISLNEFIETCETVVGKGARINQVGEQMGDVPITCADITKAKRDLNYHPKVSLEDGLNYLKKWLVRKIN